MFFMVLQCFLYPLQSSERIVVSSFVDSLFRLLKIIITPVINGSGEGWLIFE